MSDMITYIFSSLRSSEKRLDAITRAVRKQGNFNAKLTVFAAVTTANLILMQIEQKDQAMRIRKLEKEIEDLKHPEGE
ncbi:hypothetical protein DW841_11985 [Hungatella hathewayi]|jgi:hypothetical protein|nr:hypothetical protein DW841_11985 [Hungatella hathewayi]UVY57047.1 MAG: hypothetical protein [Bacteriophage sp.]DAP99159.1 MAG TPA: hypothetical protein [Caudoviricetes sp.]